MGYYGATQACPPERLGPGRGERLTKPIYTPAQLHVDAWITYAFKLPWDNGKIKCKVQLNCVDLTSNGYILPIAVQPTTARPTPGASSRRGSGP